MPLRDLLECVAAPAPRYFLTTAAALVCGSPDTPPPGAAGRRRFQVGVGGGG